MSVLVKTTHLRHDFRLTRVFDHLTRMLAIRRQRRALLNMDAHMLRDIGLTRGEAAAEAERPIWDVPQFWL